MPALFARFAIFAICTTALAAPLHAATNTLSVTLQLAGLPSTITLCRDQTAARLFGLDESWSVGIDVDTNAATPISPPGGPALGGIDVILQAQTLPQSPTCTPSTASTQSSVVATAAVWDSSAQNYVQSEVPVSLAFDFTANTITMTVPLIGPLANMKGSAPMYADAGGSYTPTATPTSPTFTNDNGNSFSISAAAIDPADDVQSCSAPCSPSAPWYKLVDLVGASAAVSTQIPMYGVDTVYFEFDMAGLPSTISLCRYPQTSTFSDSDWAVVFNENTNTGIFNDVVQAYTTPQQSGCSPSSAPLGQSVQAEIDHWDQTTNNYVTDAILPVTADASTSKIIIQADRNATDLAGLSQQTQMYEQTSALYPSTGTYPFAYDDVGPLSLGTAVSTASGNVQSCTSPCSPTVPWYPQIDLVGGYIHLADHIFTGDFE